MSKHPKITNRPTTCRDRNRLMAARIMLSALMSENLRESDLLDEDDKLASLLGASRHKRLRLALTDENGQLDESNYLGKATPRLRTLAKKYLCEYEVVLIAKSRQRQDVLSANVRKLSRILGLNRTEAKLLDLMVRMDSDAALAEVTSIFESMTAFTLVKMLARATGSRHEHVRAAISPESRLSQSGVLEMSTSFFRGSRRMVHCGGIDDITLLPGLAHALLYDSFDFERIFSSFFKRCGTPKLALSHFDYLKDEVVVLRGLLEGALRKQVPGMQILFYGPPGTGKTQLAHALAQAIGVPMYSVATGSVNGEPYDRDDRFRSYRLAQQALKSRGKAIVLFDEVEDVFPDNIDREMRSSRQKGWTNELLETNAAPSIWITNSTTSIDAAYLRRFSLVLKIERPPRAIRRQIADQHLSEFAVDTRVMSRIADADRLTPADLDRTRRALSVANTLTTNADTASRAATILLGSGPNGPGRSALLPKDSFALPEFDPALINTDLDLPKLINGLARSGEGRLCLYGPPGTGKTAFAGYVARHLERELITVSASDWLNCYLGETEKRIRDGFESAERANAVLFVDEADSFLRDRSLASKSWETTQVNELLKCLEDASGIVMFATNAFDVLDPAVLRRLDIKTAFRPLNREQAKIMFERCLAVNSSEVLVGITPEIASRLRLITGLVNGDFAAACRYLHIMGQPFTASYLLTALESEVAMRSRHEGKSIGFVTGLN